MGSRFGPQRLPARFSLGFLLISGMISAGCVNKEGEPLPPGLMSFPIAIELSVDTDTGDPTGEPSYVFVASSNFALQYNSGSVQSYDLEKINAAIDTGCVGAGIRESCLAEDFEGDINSEGCACDPEIEADCVAIPPDRCSVIPAELRERDVGAALKLVEVEDLLLGEVEIGSFADGLGIATSGRRLYLPVRSDANLTFIDVNEQGQLSCGGAFGTRHTCTEPYRSGSVEQVNPTVPLVLPSDPVDVFVGDLAADFAPPDSPPNDPAFLGDYILMAHREGEASMFFDQLRTTGPEEPRKRPRLAATIDELAPEQVTITYEPGAKKAWISSALSTQVIRVGIAIDGDPSQSFLFDAGTLVVTGLDTGNSSRDILFDPRGRDLAYIVSRSPESLIIARRDVAGDELSVVRQVSVCRGPSRIQLAEVPVPLRGTVLLAFVSCFNARNVQIIDTDLFQGVTILTNISGAFEFVIDGPRLRMYMADFSTSVLRVATLEPVVACLEAGSDAPEECAPEVLGLVGLPQPVSELPR